MSSSDSSPRATESFQRLEDFSTFTSCIKCFGKPIIPPLLTAEQREELFQFRTAAVNIEVDNVKKKEHSSLSEKVKEVYRRVEEHLASCSNDDFVSYCESAQNESSALDASKGSDFQTCPSTDTTFLTNEMHVSTCKIPSSDICSTVHKDVIVFPNVVNTKDEDASRIDEKCPTSCTDQNELELTPDNPACCLCQVDSHQDWPANSIIPSENVLAGQMHSVSEDEHDSITESTEFESLPTVINARRFVSQDTDNESNATCLSQSTDLEKYMDSSIEYSSPEDAYTLAQSQMSNQLNMSTRSDDASSETLVNTENELTPCASAMAILSYSDETSSEIAGEKSLYAFSIADVIHRAHSVDSYMKMVKSCAKKLPVRKSQSEPSYTKSTQYSAFKDLPAELAMEGQDPKTGEFIGDSQLLTTPISDSEISSGFESKTDIKKSLKRKHVRTNSYTLDHPSPALIRAHAGCHCREESPNLSPHSCTLGKKSVSPPNPAFRKEKVNIVLPPTPERDKYFPVFSSMTLSVNKMDGNNMEDSKMSTSVNAYEAEMQLPEAGFLNSPEGLVITKTVDNYLPTLDTEKVQNLKDDLNWEPIEKATENVNDLYAITQEETQQNEQITKSSNEPSELRNSDIKELLNQVIRDVKENQKNRVNQFFEEQNKLWFQMQKEFKEQERLLCEKLNIVNISSFSDGAISMPYPCSDAEEKESSVENTLSKPNANENFHPNADSAMGENCLTVKSPDNESSGVDASKMSHSTKSVSDVTSPPNFKATELTRDSNDHSRSPTSVSSSTNPREEIGSSPLNYEHSPSLSITSANDSLQTNTVEEFSDGYRSLQSSMSLKSITNADRQFRNQTMDVLSDSIHSSVSIMSEASDDDQFKASTYGPVAKLTGPNCLESTCSSISFRTSSDLSQNSDMAKLFCDSQFLKENSCPACASISSAHACVDLEHEKSASICSDCHSCLKCYCFESKHISHENLPGDEDRQYPIPLSPEEFATSSSLFCQEKDATYVTTGSLPLQTPDHSVTKMSFNNINSNILDFNSSETTNSDITEQYPLSNNNLRPNMHSKQNRLVMNTKNNLSERNIQQDNCYGEDEIRAINDLVQSSYTSSYSCQLNEDYCRTLIATSDSPKNQNHAQGSQSSYQLPLSVASSIEKGAPKQIVSTSLTNRKRSRDIIKDPILLKKFEKLPALVKGYLTRRLFKTERVQDLIKTLQDTALLVGKLSHELNLKGNSVSENDVDFHRQLIVQLFTTFESVYDIFCTMSIKEQMKIISKSRNFRLKKMAAEKKESTVPVVKEKCRSSPNKKPKLSAATLKALERKRSSIDSRTYTIEDFKGCKPRIQTISSTKSRNTSPSRIYKSGAGTSMKRKTASVRKTSPWK